MQTLPAIYLVLPHARLIAEKAKTLIVKSRKFEKYFNQPIYFMEDSRVYGILKITKIDGPLPLYNVKVDLANKHHISDEEWEEWWPNITEFYCYYFDLVEVFDKPKYFEPAPGVQTFIREVELSEVTPRIVTKEEYQTLIQKYEEVQEFLSLSYSRFKCMRCSNPPTVDVLFAEGMGRVWFCDTDFEKWKKEHGGPWTKSDPEYDPNYTHEKDICKVYKVHGEVPLKWKEHYSKHDEKIQHEMLDYLTYMKEFDIDKADPREWSKRVLLHFHAKTHAWYRRLLRGDP
jgi:hypothetical protein